MKYLNKYINYINESSQVDEGVDIVKNKFIEFVNNLDKWNSINQDIFKLSENTPDFNYTDSRSVYHEYALFQNKGFKLTKMGDNYTRPLVLDSNIKYYIIGEYSTNFTQEFNFFVYDDNEFKEAVGNHLDYFKGLEEKHDKIGSEIMIIDYIIKVDYDDWLSDRNQILDIMRKLNK